MGGSSRSNRKGRTGELETFGNVFKCHERGQPGFYKAWVGTLFPEYVREETLAVVWEAAAGCCAQ
jgi:hypothetical protein